MSILSRVFEEALKLPPPQTPDIRVERDLAVPMPDGAVLLADRHFPRGTRRPPLVLVRSPYGRRGFWGLVCRAFARRGFQVLVQSCRGTFGSGGVFDPFGPDERTDGLATVAWMRRQPWYPGAFGTFGPSYLGIVQWAIAADAAPDHKAIAAQVTTSDLRAPFYGLAGESFSLETMLGWVVDVAQQERPFAWVSQLFGGRQRARRRLQALFRHLPLADLDRLATGHRVTYWQEWLAHNEPGDDYWRDRGFHDTLARVTTPINLVAGWYDFLLPAQLRDYAALRDAGRAPYLTIGPWRHGDPGGIAAGIRESLTWLGAHLLGERSRLRPDPVRIFVTGAGEWRDLPAWPPAAHPARWYLHADGRLSPDLLAPSDPDRYTYDPADPTPNLAGPVGEVGAASVDNRPLEARPDVLTYTSAPLERDLEVIGEVTADLYVGSSRPHTDFFARLCDVDPAGVSLNICDALLRLAPGRPAAGADGTIRARFPLWPTAHRFRRGHRLRLQVSSGAHPRFARNPGSGEPLGTATTLLTAEQRVYHDPDHPSAVVLPVTAG